jgi:hypothetical protein
MFYRKHPAAAQYVADHVRATGPVSIRSIRQWLSDQYPADLTYNEQTCAILDAVNRQWIRYIADCESYDHGPIAPSGPTTPPPPATTTPPCPSQVVYQLIAYPADTDPTDERSYTLAIFKHQHHADLFAKAIVSSNWRTTLMPITNPAHYTQLYDLFT